MTKTQKAVRDRLSHLTEDQLKVKLEGFNRVIPELQEEQYVVRQMLKTIRCNPPGGRKKDVDP